MMDAPKGRTQPASSGNAEDATERAFHFWVFEVHKDPNARSLAAELGLDLPAGNLMGFKSGLMYPVRRLVVTGKDTPEHFRMLFGVDDVPDTHAEARKAVLLSAGIEKGSPNDLMQGFMDKGCPYWAPRPANEEEEEDNRKQLEFNQRFKGFF